MNQSLVFGPVPSRRLGRSLGINNIPPKHCSYACIYCQVGTTTSLQLDRRHFYGAEKIVSAVTERLEQLRGSGERVDYLSFVPDGEPTLDLDLGRELELLKPLGVPLAVITNATLLSREEVRRELAAADWVSVKVDTVNEQVWRKLNRPTPTLSMQALLDGIVRFAGEYRGQLVTETMLVSGLYDTEELAAETAGFIARLSPRTAFLSVPIRPPAIARVRPPDAQALNRVFQIFQQLLGQVEVLSGYEGDAFASTGDPRADLLSITAVHPLRREAAERLLRRSGEDWRLVEKLEQEGLIAQVDYRGATFVVRQPNAHD